MKVSFSMKRLLVALLNKQAASYFARSFRTMAHRDFRRAATVAWHHRFLADQWCARGRMYRGFIAEAMRRVLEAVIPQEVLP